MNNFNGLYIKSIRKKLELSSTEAAKAIGISPTTLSRIENCSLACSKEIFESVVDFFEEQDSSLSFNSALSTENLKERINKELDIWLVKFLDYSFFEGLDELEKVVCNNSLRNSVIHFEIELLDSFLESIKFNDYQKILAFDIDHSLLNTIVSSAFMFLAYDLLGLAQVYCTRKPNKAIEYFQMSEAYIKGDNRYRLSAINKYHVILAVMADMDHISALSLFDSCFIALQKVGAYRRMAYMEIYKGVCFQNLGLFNQAENIYKK